MKKFSYCIQFFQNHRIVFYILLIALFLLRFYYLNYINWHSGTLASGHGGIQYGADSPRYIHGAERIFTSYPLGSDQIRYFGYIVFLAITLKLQCGFIISVIFQVSFAMLASIAIYDLGRSITGSKTAGILAAGLFLVNPFVVNWHLYIHSDSLYFSFLIFSVWSIFKAIGKQKLKFYFLSVAIVLITATIRPNGWVLLPIMFCFYLLNRNLKVLVKVLIVFSVFALFFLGARYFKVSEEANSDIEFVKLLQTGVIVWGHEDLRLNMPDSYLLKNKHWSEIGSYIVKHPYAVIHLAIARLSAEYLQMYRPWSSFKYKARFLVWMLPGYILALIGTLLLWKNVGIKLIVVVLLSQMLIIASTCSEHECRYMLSTVSLIYLLAVCGLFAIVQKFSIKFEK